MRRLFRLVAMVVAPAALLVTACGPPPVPPPPPPPPPVGPVAIVRDHAVGVRDYVFTDANRSTPAYGGFPGSDERTLPTRVWYPTGAGGPYPLVVFAHGFGVDPTFYDELLARIASAGYVVAAPTLPILSGDPSGPSDAVDWDEHYGDLQFVTSVVVWISGDGDAALGGKVDGERIAVMGHSDGALLAFGDALEADRTDERVRAVVAYAADLDDGGTYQANGRALLHVVSENDAYNDFGATLAWDHNVAGDPTWTVALWGAGHAPPYTDPDDPHFDAVVQMTIAFLDFQLKARSADPFVAAVNDNPSLTSFA